MNIIDLFAGCGGMSTGFEMAGFNTVLAVEKDEWAGATYQHNHPNTKVHIGSITDIQDLNQLSNQYELSQNIDGIIGAHHVKVFHCLVIAIPKTRATACLWIICVLWHTLNQHSSLWKM